MNAKLVSTILLCGCFFFVGCQKDYEPGDDSHVNNQDSIPGNQDSFPKNYTRQEGALTGFFKVTDSTYIAFSRGNLRYNAYKDVWSFAEQQYDYGG